MHDPSSFDPIGSPMLVKNQCFSHPHNGPGSRVEHNTILAGGLPIARDGGLVCPVTGCVFTIVEAKEVPLL